MRMRLNKIGNQLIIIVLQMLQIRKTEMRNIKIVDVYTGYGENSISWIKEDRFGGEKYDNDYTLSLEEYIEALEEHNDALKDLVKSTERVVKILYTLLDLMYNRYHTSPLQTYLLLSN